MDDIEIDKLAKHLLGTGSNVSFFLVSDKRILRCYKGHVNSYATADSLGLIRGMSLGRGNVLDFFTKLDFFINQIFSVKFFGFYSKRSEPFNELLNNIDFSSKIKILKKWGVVKKETFKILWAINTTRNGFAHRWSIDEAEYKNVPIRQNFEMFKKDSEAVWLDLIGIYTKMEGKEDLTADKFIDKIKKEAKRINVRGLVEKSKEADEETEKI